MRKHTQSIAQGKMPEHFRKWILKDAKSPLKSVWSRAIHIYPENEEKRKFEMRYKSRGKSLRVAKGKEDKLTNWIRSWSLYPD